MEPSIEELYGISKREVQLERVQTKSGKWLEKFEGPLIDEVGSNRYEVKIKFPEFTCRCPRTGHPDFATIIIKYMPDKWCVELKSLKYYLNAYRDEGHFHEEVCNLIWEELVDSIEPLWLTLIGEFNVRGGIRPVVTVGEDV